MMITYKRIPLSKNQPFSFSRKLSDNSRIEVKVGDIVHPETIVAYTWRRSGFRVFNLADLFDVEIGKTRDILKKTVGSRVYKGDELANYKQFFGLKEKIFRSPINGILVDYNPETSKLTLQYLPTEIKVTSGVFGRIIKVLPGERIQIGTKVNIIIGVTSFGVQSEGTLVEAGYPDIPIQPDQILNKHENKIIFGGTKIGLDALYKALSLGVKAVITGGMDYEDFIHLIGSEGRLENIGISILLTEGFGGLPIYTAVYDYLKESEHRHVLLMSKDNSVVIPVSSEVLAEEDLPQRLTQRRDVRQKFGLLKKDYKVRILSGDKFGEYGIVSDVKGGEGTVEITLQKGKVAVSPEEVEIIGE